MDNSRMSNVRFHDKYIKKLPRPLIYNEDMFDPHFKKYHIIKELPANYKDPEFIDRLIHIARITGEESCTMILEEESKNIGEIESESHSEETLEAVVTPLKKFTVFYANFRIYEKKLILSVSSAQIRVIVNDDDAKFRCICSFELSLDDDYIILPDTEIENVKLYD
jgi:hypothetical protein